MHAMRLSSVWTINFQYHSPAAATGYSCVDYNKIAENVTVAQQLKRLKKQKVGFRVYGCGSLAKKVRVSVS